jgi:biopolymer transport protein ExbB/TolQ
MSLHEIFEETKKNFMVKKRLTQLDDLERRISSMEARYDALRESEAAVARSIEEMAKIKEVWDRAAKEVLAVDLEKLDITQQQSVNAMMDVMMLQLDKMEMDKKNLPILEDIIAKCQKLPHIANETSPNPNA